MSRSRYKFFEDAQPYFLTATTVEWIPLFSRPVLAEILLDSLQFLSSAGRMQLHAYVIMEHHIHLVASGEKLDETIGDFKSFTARKIIDLLKEQHAEQILVQLRKHKCVHKHDREYQVWQEGSHPQIIGSAEMMRQKIAYIHHNPVRRGYVDDPCYWRYSSARNYAGEKGLIEVCTEW